MSYPVQKLYLDKIRKQYFLEQDIKQNDIFGLFYNRKGIVYCLGHGDFKQVGDSMEHTQCADKYSNYELKVIEETYPGVGLRYFLARETYSDVLLEENILTEMFYEMIKKIDFKNY